jgi:hypothetical protein
MAAIAPLRTKLNGAIEARAIAALLQKRPGERGEKT